MGAPRVSEAIVSAAAELWAKGLSAEAIGAQVGKTKNAICSIARKRRALFPERVSRTDRRTIAPKIVKTPVKPVEPVRRTSTPVPPPKADAWLPLPATTPVGLMRVCGCRWPVESEDDRFVRASTYFCDAPRHMKPDRFGKLKQSSYCATHDAMSVGSGTPSERSAVQELARAG